MDWERVFARLEEDTAVLAAVTTLFRWMCPGRAAELPEWIWKKLALIPEGRPAPRVGPPQDQAVQGRQLVYRGVS